MSAVATLRRQLAETQAKLEAETQKLQAERARLVARLAEIDAELGGGEARPAKTRAKGVSEAVLTFVTAHPGSTIREVQAGLSELPGPAVEAAVRGMATKGTLQKDDSVPRRFSVPVAPVAEAAPAPAPTPPPNGKRSNDSNSRKASGVGAP